MKKITLIIIAAVLFLFSSCKKESWSNGDPAYEHIYYYGFQNWGTLKNDVKYNVTRGAMLAIPVQFYSERVRDYDVKTYYYVAGTMLSGTDYQIVDSLGTALTQNDNGAYEMNWPKAVKGIKNIYMEALNGATGTLTVQTFDPNASIPISSTDVSTTTNSKTEQYEVRAFSQNYKVSVTIK